MWVRDRGRVVVCKVPVDFKCSFPFEECVLGEGQKWCCEGVSMVMTGQRVGVMVVMVVMREGNFSDADGK